jgi:hypothetical protein
LTSTTDNCCQRAKVHRWVAQPGLFAKCHDHVALYILGTCVIFLRLHFIALLFYFIALLFYFIALLFNFFKCKKALILYSGCKPALILFFYSSKYETVSNFCLKTISCSYFFIIFWIILNMFQMLFLIMYKTSRF